MPLRGLVGTLLLTASVHAQTFEVATPDGGTVVVSGELPGAAASPRPVPSPAKSGAADAKPPSAGDAKPGAKPDEKKPGDKPDAAAELKNVTRGAKPPEPPDPDELKVGLDSAGLLQFQFRNQPWPEVLRWLASVSNLSLDWQELPGDYLNLATQHPHTLAEATDMINRGLLVRGFTLLENDGVMSVAKIEGINPSMVPRVRADDLLSLSPNQFVRTSFELEWLIAEEVHTEFASMISKNGKLIPLASTNRLEAMDAAANLRDIYQILQQEQSSLALENLAREFVLTNARATQVKEQLEVFLGIENGGGGSKSSMDPNAMRMMQQQMQQQMQQMQQQMQQAGRGAEAKGSPAKKRPEEVYIVANDRNNSVIVHAQPDKMAIIAAFIARVDIPNANAADYQRLQTRMKVYRLASLSPGELVASLTAMDVLEPMTQLRVDENNRAIIAYASIADQYLIQSIIDRLDGSERSFEVVQLRRLDAESVAGSIKFLMGAEEEDSSKSSRRSYYDYYSYGRSSSTDEKKDKMRVGANVQDNQILLWANAIEMEEVQNLLKKLGEIPPDGGRRSTVRVIDAARQPETYEYLKRLKEEWDKVSPSPLVIPDASEFQPPPKEQPATETPVEPNVPKANPKGQPIDSANERITSTE